LVLFSESVSAEDGGNCEEPAEARICPAPGRDRDLPVVPGRNQASVWAKRMEAREKKLFGKERTHADLANAAIVLGGGVSAKAGLTVPKKQIATIRVAVKILGQKLFLF